MDSCFQFKNQSILEHGESVHSYFIDLKKYITKNIEPCKNWKLPEWINDPFLWENLVNDSDIKNYHIYHDCGKPFCIKYDQEGKKHFPDHESVSYEIWKKISNNDNVGNLIRRDMEIHTLKSDQCHDFCKDKKMAVTLLITGLCELHSNSTMFGGIDSVSFKIKWKQINKRGKKILNIIKEKESEND